MKRLIKKFLFLSVCLVSIGASGQNLNLVNPITITIPNNPPANTEDWARSTPPVMIMAQAKAAGQNGTIQARVLVTIKKGSAKVCGDNTPQTAPLHEFDPPVKIWTGANLLSLLGSPCTLPPGDYELCVQFYEKGGRVLLGENCKPFTIKENKQENYAPPQNIIPAIDKKFTLQEAKGVISFRWTPVVPKPKETVTYRLKVWQLVQGQNATQAMRTNQPIITKEVDNITQAAIANFLTGPCKPPYLCDFVWNIEALSKEQVQGRNKSFGVSEPTVFKIIVDESNIGSCIKLDTSKYTVVCKGLNAGGQYVYQVQGLIFNKEALNTDPFMESGPTGGPVVNYVTPVVPATATITNIIPPSVTASVAAVQTVSFDVVSSTVLSVFTVNLQMSTYHLSAAGTKIYCSKNYEMTFDAPPCGCKTCDSVQIKLPAPTTGQVNNNVTIKQNLSTLALPSGMPLSIKSISAEITYFDIIKNDTLCYRCEKNNAHFGKFVKATMSNTGFTNTTGLPGDEVVFSTTAAQPLNNATADFEIAAPDINKCCSDVINVCIRYSIITLDCKTCSVTQCYKLPRSK